MAFGDAFGGHRNERGLARRSKPTAVLVRNPEGKSETRKQVNRPDLAEVDTAAESRFATGHEVGAIACALLPDGHMVAAEPI